VKAIPRSWIWESRSTPSWGDSSWSTTPNPVAGLPDLHIRLDARIGDGPDFEGYGVAACFTAALLDSMGERGQELTAETDLHTLEQRIRD
jgi:hypothetical protein